MFGVYTHAQFDRRLWSAVSKFLSGKGPEYRKRYFRSLSRQTQHSLCISDVSSAKLLSTRATFWYHLRRFPLWKYPHRPKPARAHRQSTIWNSRVNNVMRYVASDAVFHPLDTEHILRPASSMNSWCTSLWRSISCTLISNIVFRLDKFVALTKVNRPRRFCVRFPLIIPSS